MIENRPEFEPSRDTTVENSHTTEPDSVENTAQAAPKPPLPRPGKSQIREWIESLAFTVLFVLIFTRFIAQATQVPTESMKPTIMVGDHFFLDKLAFPANYPTQVRPYLPERSLERGNIVAFRAPVQGDIPFVKRLIGTPGDVIEIRNKRVWINGAEIEEPYKIHVDGNLYENHPWTPHEYLIRDNYGPVTLGENAYFVMGDNRDNSNDSRYWGFIGREDIIGKPMFVYWSYAGDTYAPGRRTIIDRVASYASIVGHFFTRTRWFRMGMAIE
jgi:signal peptidase I